MFAVAAPIERSGKERSRRMIGFTIGIEPFDTHLSLLDRAPVSLAAGLRDDQTHGSLGSGNLRSPRQNMEHRPKENLGSSVYVPR